jgi:hypothetical protein
VLRIVSYGYADRVEVEFPEGMSALDPGLDAVFDYGDAPSWRQEEVLRFLVPLYAPEGGFQVTVRAYKGGKKLEEHPAVSVIGVSGSVLDGLRTRLR